MDLLTYIGFVEKLVIVLYFIEDKLDNYMPVRLLAYSTALAQFYFLKVQTLYIAKPPSPPPPPSRKGYDIDYPIMSGQSSTGNQLWI